jgi:ketosteroid isomerase-like protein
MSRENVAVVRRLLDAMEAEDFPTALSCLDPDLEFIPLRAATEGAYRGHEGFEKFYEDTVESFEIFEPRYELGDLGNQVLAWGTIHLRGRGSGVEMDVTTGGVFDVRDGKITRWEDLGSKEKALEAVGLR